MYICKECNAQYKVKPDYCDCGNNTFDYIEEKTAKQPLTLEQKSEIVSRIFFLICLLFAVSVWFIPLSKKPVQQAPAKVKTVTNIPDINKIWDDTPIYQPKEQPVEVRTEPIKLTPTPVDYARRTN